MTTKAKGSSVRQRLINLSTTLDVPYQYLETAFILERLVARFTVDDELRKHLVFKGGFVGLKVYDSTRYTVDVDALVINADVDSILGRARACAETDLEDGVWFRYGEQMDLATQGEYGGIRQTYRAGIGELLKDLKKARVVHFDVGIGDPVTPGPLVTETTSLILPESSLTWLVYPVETIIAEKIHALVAHGDLNSRAKDVYDLAILLPKADDAILREALRRCFEHRSTELPHSLPATLRPLNTTSLERGWVSATASVPTKPQFSETFESIIKFLERLNDSL